MEHLMAPCLAIASGHRALPIGENGLRAQDLRRTYDSVRALAGRHALGELCMVERLKVSSGVLLLLFRRRSAWQRIPFCRRHWCRQNVGSL